MCVKYMYVDGRVSELDLERSPKCHTGYVSCNIVDVTINQEHVNNTQ